MSEALEAVKNLTAVAEKLLSEVERLQRDVSKFNWQFNEKPPEPPAYVRTNFRKTWPIVDAMNTIEEARALIKGCEYDIAAIRAKLDDEQQDNGDMIGGGRRMVPKDVWPNGRF